MRRILSVAFTCTIATMTLGACAQHMSSMSSQAGSSETTKSPEVAASHQTTFDSVTPPSPPARALSSAPAASAPATTTGTTFDSVTPPGPPATAYSSYPSSAPTSTTTTASSSGTGSTAASSATSGTSYSTPSVSAAGTATPPPTC